MIRRSLLIAAFALVQPGLALADPERSAIQHDLRQTEQQREQAQADTADAARTLSALETELQVLAGAMKLAARDVRRHEGTIAKISESLIDVQRQHAARQEELAAKRAQAGRMLSALVRLTAIPPDAALFGPGGSDQRMRSALLVRGLVPRLQQDAGRLQLEVRNIKTAQAKITAEQARLTKAKSELATRIAALARVVEQKNALLVAHHSRLSRTVAVAERFAKSAASLRDLLNRINAESYARHAAVSAERQRRALAAFRVRAQSREPDRPLQLAGLSREEAALIAPVTGQVVFRFGENAGKLAKGITIKGKPVAPVLAPADGRVVYSGPFQDYGVLLIIEHGGGFHTVLNGLAQTKAMAGQWVLAGEPLGTGGEDRPLYVELRQNGVAVDPLDWFTVDQS